MIQHLFIISDGTGKTAEHVVRAALVQFEDIHVQIKLCPHISSRKQVVDIITDAQEVRGLVVHTVVSSKLRDIIERQGRLFAVDTIDLIGPLLARLSHHFSYIPTEKPGIYHELNKSYFKRIEAVEYTLRHDDGQRMQELNKAEIVILGVSRTFKTPVSIYLAYKGWLVANIPIILGMDPPEELFRFPVDRVFCLMTNPNLLGQLRKTREQHLGGNIGEYAKHSHILKELEYANSIYKRQPKWTIIEISNKSVEEISMEILCSIRNKEEPFEKLSS